MIDRSDVGLGEQCRWLDRGEGSRLCTWEFEEKKPITHLDNHGDPLMIIRYKLSSGGWSKR